MSAPTPVPPIDEAKLNEFMGKAVTDMGAAIHAVIILLGDRLGLYKAMADCQPVSATELAHRTGLHERYVREWLHANAASGYITYDAVAKTFTLPPPSKPWRWPSRIVQSICPVFSSYSPPVATTHLRSKRLFGPAKAWAGTSTMRISSAGPDGSSVQTTTRI
jgi:hypothetical protein